MKKRNKIFIQKKNFLRKYKLRFLFFCKNNKKNIINYGSFLKKFDINFYYFFFFKIKIYYFKNFFNIYYFLFKKKPNYFFYFYDFYKNFYSYNNFYFYKNNFGLILNDSKIKNTLDSNLSLDFLKNLNKKKFLKIFFILGNSYFFKNLIIFKFFFKNLIIFNFFFKAILRLYKIFCLILLYKII